MKLNYAYLFIPILVLLGVYYFYDASKDAEKKTADMASQLGFDASQVLVVEIGSDDNKTRIARKQDQWVLESPIQSDADNDAVDDLIKQVMNIEVGRSLGKLDDTNRPEYGLEEPSYKLNLLGEGGSALMSFALGTENPSNSGRYATTGKGNLYLLSPSATAFTAIGTKELRARAIVIFDPAAVTGFECATNDVDYSFTQESGAWFLEKPERLKVSDNWCQGFLTILQRARAEEFLEGEPDYASLSPLSGFIRLHEQGGAVQEVTFLGVDPVKGIVARSSRLPEPFYTEFRLEEYVNVDIDTFRELRLILFTQPQIGSVVFREVGGVNLEFNVEKGEYRITKPAERLVYKQTDFDDFFNAVLGIEALRFAEAPGDLSTIGLEPYWVKIEMYSTDNTSEVELYLGAETSDGYYANIDKADQVFIISKDQVDAIIRAANKLRIGVARL